MQDELEDEKEVFQNQLNNVGDGRFQLFAAIILGVKKKKNTVQKFFFC